MNNYFIYYHYRMPQFAFNKELWEAGRRVEDAALPELNKYFDHPNYYETQIYSFYAKVHLHL